MHLIKPPAAVILFLILLGACGKHAEFKHDTTRIIIPLYSFPTDEGGNIWNDVLTASQSVPVAVIWGMVDTADAPVYRQYISRFRSSKNISLYAYVATTSGQRPETEVRHEIDYYGNNFDIDGIFFDEVSSDNKYISYYRSVIGYAKQNSKIKRVILNSSYAPPGFPQQTGADVLIIFENYVTEWYNFSFSDYDTLPAPKKAVIVENVFSVGQMEEIIHSAASHNIGYLYVTDRDYDRLPSFWFQEVEQVKRLNRR